MDRRTSTGLGVGIVAAVLVVAAVLLQADDDGDTPEVADALENVGDDPPAAEPDADDPDAADPDAVTVETVAEGFGQPWGLAFLPERAAVVGHRAGRCRVGRRRRRG